MFAHLIRQRAWQLDGEHHVGLGNFNPSSSHGLLHVPACLTDRHAVPTGHRASGGNGGHPRPDQIGGGVDPPGVLDAIDTITPNHVMNILPIMTPPTPWARKTLQPPVAERHLEAEVAHCVGGVATPPWGVPACGCSSVSPASTPALSHPMTSLSIRRSLTRSASEAPNTSGRISSKKLAMSASTTQHRPRLTSTRI